MGLVILENNYGDFTGYEPHADVANKEHRFEINDDNAAEWALSKIAEINAEEERLVSVCAQRILFYTEKTENAKEKAENDRAYFEGLLLEYFDKIKPKETKTQLTYALPSGVLKRTKEKRDFKLVDEAAVVESLRGTDFVKTTEKVAWGELKKTLQFAPDTVTVITEYGEVIPGVTFEEKPGKFEVKIDKEAL